MSEATYKSRPERVSTPVFDETKELWIAAIFLEDGCVLSAIRTRDNDEWSYDRGHRDDIGWWLVIPEEQHVDDVLQGFLNGLILRAEGI